MAEWRWLFVGGQFDGWSCPVQVHVRDDQAADAHPPELYLWEDSEAINVGWKYSLPTPPEHAIRYPRAKIEAAERKVTYGLEPVSGGGGGARRAALPAPAKPMPSEVVPA